MSDPNGPDRAEIAKRLEDAKERLHMMQAVGDALARWPEVSALAWTAESTDELRTQLSSLFGLDEAQASAVMDQQLRKIPIEQRVRIRTEIDELHTEIARLESGTLD